ANLTGLPAGHNASFAENGTHTGGTLTWTPTFADSGTYTVTFTGANTLSTSSTTSIHVVDVNRGPVVTAPASVTVNENATLTLVVSAADPEGEAIASLTAALAALPAGNGAAFTEN